MDTKQYVDVPWLESFDDRQIGLVNSCRQYVADGAPGLPGHQLMLIVAKMAAILDVNRIAVTVELTSEPR